MKLLMITRKVDRQDHLAGFTYTWVKKIAENVDELKVICLQSGDLSELPQNVKVFSLDKKSKLAKFLSFNKLAFKLIPRIDGVFCHQNPEYTIAIAPYAKLFRKKIVSWYTHGSISFRLKVLEKLANVILTASKESFRLPSKKVKIVGHGIDLDQFYPVEQKQDNQFFNIVSIGRISPTKDYESMIKAISILADQGIKNIKLEIIGEAGLKEQAVYFENLKQMALKMNLNDKIKFLGAIPNVEIPKYLQQSDAFINLSGTGSIDKAILEAMACGCLVLTSNEAFAGILPPDLMVEKDQPNKLTEKIKYVRNLSNEKKEKIKSELRNKIIQNHNLDILAKKIIEQF